MIPASAKKRLFVLDDNFASLRVVEMMLANSGIIVSVHLINEGVEAHLVACLPVHLILLDIMLSNGVSGYDIFKMIRANPLLSDIPVAAISSLGLEIEMPKLQSLGFAGYFGKPINSITFKNNVLALMDGQKLWVPGL